MRRNKAWERSRRDVPWRMAFEITVASELGIKDLRQRIVEEVGVGVRFVVDVSNISGGEQKPHAGGRVYRDLGPLAPGGGGPNAALLSRLPSDGQHIRVFTGPAGIRGAAAGGGTGN